MLTYSMLVQMYRDLQGQEALSVYLDAEAHDPALRSAWRRRLDHGLSRIRQSLVDPEARQRFEQAAERVTEALSGFDAFLPDRGWVGFATSDELLYGETLPVPMPDLVAWGQGIRVAPYIRGLKQNRLVATVVLDQRRARLFRYRAGVLSEPVDMLADVDLGDLSDVTAAKRATTRSGMRGVTGTDVAHRLLEVGAERLAKGVLEVVADMVGEDGFMILGGTQEMIAVAARHLPRGLKERVTEMPSLHLEMSVAALREAIEPAASMLSREIQAELLDDVVDRARAQGRGCLGREETEQALDEGRVETLLLTRRFREAEPELADRLVGAALLQGSGVEELSGEPADRLDSEGGIGARLRYRLRVGEMVPA